MTPSHAIAASEPDPPEARSSVASWYTPGFSDSLGDRLLMFDNTTSAPLELLRFKPEFADVPGFEDALRERVALLAGFEHVSFATPRSVRRLGTSEGLALVSHHTSGRRLSELYHLAHGPALATKLVMRLAPALAALADAGPDFSHGSLTADRIIVAPGGGLVIVEHVLGPALDVLQIPSERLRSEFGLAARASAGFARFDSQSDVVQLGLIALSLLAGRKIDPAEDPIRLRNLIEELGSKGGGAPRHLYVWLERALQLGDSTFESASDAASALGGWSGQDAFLPEQPRRADNDQDFDDLEEDLAPQPVPPERPLAVVPSPFARLYAATEADTAESRKQTPWRSMGRARWIIVSLAVLALGEGLLVTGMWLGQDRTSVVAIQAPELKPAQLSPPPVPVTIPPPPDTPPLELAEAAPPPEVRRAAPRLTVTDQESQTATRRTDVPTGLLSVTAQPWANVWIDGEPLGRTPVASTAVAVGKHEILWRHPELGERRQQIEVTATTPLSLNMNLRESAPEGVGGEP